MNKFFLTAFLFLFQLFNLDAQILKAVLLVGPQEDGTAASIRGMNEIAAFLESKSVTVYKFYDEKTDWDKISIAGEGASFFIYDGHGNNSCNLNLKNTIDKNRIIRELKLKQNAIVLFQSVCYGAGSSASDDGDIGKIEAFKRVNSYAKVFFDAGAECYFAINSNGGVLKFLKNFFLGKPVDECFKLAAKGFYNIETGSKCLFNPSLDFKLASSNWGGTMTKTTYINGKKKVEKLPASKSYSIAYVAKATYDLAGLKTSK